MWGHTLFTIITYGMMWHWLTKTGERGLSNVFQENTAFLLDELAGDPDGVQGEVKTDTPASCLRRVSLSHVGAHTLRAPPRCVGTFGEGLLGAASENRNTKQQHKQTRPATVGRCRGGKREGAR